MGSRERGHQKRGGKHGYDIQDWLKAERQITQRSLSSTDGQSLAKCVTCAWPTTQPELEKGRRVAGCVYCPNAVNLRKPFLQRLSLCVQIHEKQEKREFVRRTAMAAETRCRYRIRTSWAGVHTRRVRQEPMCCCLARRYCCLWCRRRPCHSRP